MASMRTIGRLYAPERASATVADLQPKDAPVKCPNFGQLQVDVSAPPPPERTVRGRFRVSRQDPTETSYSVDPAMIMSSVAEAAPVDRTADFAALAVRERFEQVLRRHLGARGLHRL
jgi:hypothetical protein